MKSFYECITSDPVDQQELVRAAKAVIKKGDDPLNPFMQAVIDDPVKAIEFWQGKNKPQSGGPSDPACG